MEENEASTEEKSQSSQNILVATVVIAIVIVALGYLWYQTNSSQNSLEKASQMPPISAQSPSATSSAGVITLAAQNGSGETGLAIIKELNGKVVVGVTVSGEPQGASQPAHLDTGTCDSPSSLVYSLKNVENGVSETTLSASMVDFQKKLPLVLNIHKSDSEIGNYVSCATVTASSVMTGNGSTSGATTQNDTIMMEHSPSPVTY